MTYIPVLIPDGDVKEIDDLIIAQRYLNRSDAVRDLVRKGLQLIKKTVPNEGGGHGTA